MGACASRSATAATAPRSRTSEHAESLRSTLRDGGRGSLAETVVPGSPGDAGGSSRSLATVLSVESSATTPTTEQRGKRNVGTAYVGVPEPRGWRSGSGSGSGDGLEKLEKRLLALERDARTLRERSETERRANADLMRRERATTGELLHALRLTMRELEKDGVGAKVGGATFVGASRERLATHTSQGAVLDRAYLVGITDETPDAVEIKRVHRKCTVSPRIPVDGDAFDSFSRASYSSAIAASRSVMSEGSPSRDTKNRSTDSEEGQEKKKDSVDDLTVPAMKRATTETDNGDEVGVPDESLTPIQ
jgi:hypothetical protein